MEIVTTSPAVIIRAILISIVLYSFLLLYKKLLSRPQYDIIELLFESIEREVRYMPIIDMTETGKRIHLYMRIRGISARDIQEYLHLACVQSVYKWLNGLSIPTTDNLYALSGLFHVQMDSLVVGNRDSDNESAQTISRLSDYYLLFSSNSAA